MYSPGWTFLVLAVFLPAVVYSLQVVPESLESSFQQGSAYVGFLKSEVINAGTNDATYNIYLQVLKQPPKDIALKVTLEVEKNGKYEPFFTPMTFPFCDLMKTDKLLIPTIIKFANFTVDNCPPAPGVWGVTGFKPDLVPFQILPVEEGKYKVTLVFTVDGETATQVWIGKISP